MNVKFPKDGGHYADTTLKTVITDFNNAVGGDTCSSILLPDAGAWKNPRIKSSFSDFSSLTGISDNYPITDIDAYKGKLYVTVSNSSAATSTVPTFFVFNIGGSGTISEIGNDFVDNDLKIKSGLNAVAVAEDPASGRTYAYVANASSKQLQVIDVSAIPPIVVNELALGGGSVGNSIFYKNGYIYLGLQSSTSGSEFHIIDVHNPLMQPLLDVGHWPTGHLGHDINAIYVRDRYAYLAAAGGKNLIILDVSNASAPVEMGSFGDVGNNNGKTVALVGSTLYLGRTETVGNDGLKFYILNAGNPKAVMPPVLGSGQNINKSVDAIVVRGKSEPGNSPLFPALAFLLTPSKLNILDVSDPENIIDWGSRPLEAGTFGSSRFEPVIDCENNHFYIGSTDDSANSGGYGRGKGYISAVGVDL